jgi:hypothetical protein
MRQARTHTWAPDTSPKLKSVHHAGLWVDGCLHLRLHLCKVIHLSLESSDPFHHVLSLVNPITDIPLQRRAPVRVPDRGGGSGSEARLRVTWVANPIPSVPLGLLRVSLRCSRGLLHYLHMSSPTSARWSCEAVACLSHLIKLQCNTFTRI